MPVHWRRDANIGYVELDSPPVNALGLDMRRGLLAAVEWAEAAPLDRVIVSGRGKVFCAGGDAREFDGPPLEPHLPDILNRIENSPVPWIAAADGAALGGGLELMLACRYRVAAPGTRLGLPEVTLGIVPGAGGTQRLPRLIGMEQALRLIPTGKAVDAEQALALGLINNIDPEPVYFAELTNAEWLGMAVPVGELNAGAATEEAYAAARALARRKMAGQQAPPRAIALLQAAETLPLAAGLARERAAFIELRGSDQARALRHVFFAERAAKAPPSLSRIKPEPLARIVVVGGGTMGAGIAYALLCADYRVTVLEADSDGVARAEANIDKLITDGLKRGAISEARAGALRAALTFSNTFADAAGAGLAIEAAFESMAVKIEVLGALQKVMPASAILATNTSYLDIDAMAAALDDPSRLVGLHFFAPAHIMKLLEIVRGAATSDQALARGFALARTLGKTPVLAGVCDGFIGNRILARYREAADTVFMDGSTPWEVDEAMVEFGYAMGPYEAQDLSGLDIAHANRRRQDATREPQRRYIPIADRMVELGKLGRKTGAGWYRYPGGGGRVDDPIVADLALEEAHLAGITRCDYSPDEIRRRLLLAMINEAAAIMEAGIAQSAADIDLVTVLGYGFPRWRGGLMHFADSLGATDILHGLEELAREDPLVWAPNAVIQSCAESGMTFAEWRREQAG